MKPNQDKDEAQPLAGSWHLFLAVSGEMNGLTFPRLPDSTVFPSLPS